VRVAVCPLYQYAFMTWDIFTCTFTAVVQIQTLLLLEETSRLNISIYANQRLRDCVHKHTVLTVHL
jgi:hypothetical protein